MLGSGTGSKVSEPTLDTCDACSMDWKYRSMEAGIGLERVGSDVEKAGFGAMWVGSEDELAAPDGKWAGLEEIWAEPGAFP